VRGTSVDERGLCVDRWISFGVGSSKRRCRLTLAEVLCRSPDNKERKRLLPLGFEQPQVPGEFAVSWTVCSLFLRDGSKLGDANLADRRRCQRMHKKATGSTITRAERTTQARPNHVRRNFDPFRQLPASPLAGPGFCVCLENGAAAALNRGS
jgi:hypothetical protein